MPNDLDLEAPKGELNQSIILDALNDDSEAETEETKPESKEEIKLDDLSEDEESEDKEEETDKEESEKNEEEIELKDENEEELDYSEVPSRQTILKKYPGFFKEFPGVERAMYREAEYTKVFPSVKEAKAAGERLQTFDRIENDLFSGNIENLLTSIKKSDDKAFNKITANLLDTLGKVDQAAQHKIGNYVVKSLLTAAVSKAKELGGEDGEQLTIAAQLLNRFVYGSTQITPPEKEIVEEKEDPKVKELTEREKKFNEQQLSIAVNDVTSRVSKTFKTAIEKHIDPKNLMTGYVRNKATNDVLAALDKEISTDTRFRQHLDRLWIAAKDANYSEESKSRIREALIKKAQSILPGHIKKVRADALKGTNNAVLRKPKEKDEEPETRRSAQPNKSSNSQRERPRRVGSVADVMKFLE